MKKQDLINLSKTLKLETNGLKQDLIQRILNNYVVEIAVPRSPRSPRSPSLRRSPRDVRKISNVSDLNKLVASIHSPVISSQTSESSFFKNLRRDYSGREIPRETEFKDLETLAQAAGFKMINVPLDGACMFSVIARSFGTTGANIRKIVVDYLRKCEESFEHLFEDYTIPERYLERLEEDDCWGDELTLFAATKALNFQAKVLNQHNRQWVDVGSDAGDRMIYLGYIYQFHYVALEKLEGENKILILPTSPICPPPIPRDVIEPALRSSPRIPSFKPSVPSSIREKSLQPSIPRSLTPVLLQPTRLMTLTNIGDIIRELQTPLENKLTTLNDTNMAIMKCVGLV
jgi:hypothetical protein